MAQGETFSEGGVVYRDNGDGTATVVGYDAQPGQPPRDPTFDYKGPKAGADLENTRVTTQGNALDNRITEATLPSVVQEARGKGATAGLPQGYMWGPDGKTAARIPGYTGPVDGGATDDGRKASMQNANLDSVIKQINRVQELYNSGLRDEPYSILSSIADYLPTSENKQFNAAAAGLAEQGLAAFRVPGVGSQSDTELRQFVEANKPSTSDFDSAIEEKLLQLRGRVDAARQSLGLPPAQWTGLAKQKQDDKQPGVAPPPTIGGSGGNPTPWDEIYGGGGDSNLGGGFGMDSKKVPFPEAAVQEYNAYVGKAIGGGGYLDPQDFARFYVDLTRRYAPEGAQSIADLTPYAEWADSYNQQLMKGRQTTGGTGGSIPSPGGFDVPMTLGEQARHNVSLAASPVIGAANAASFGGVEALAPEQMAALRDHENPYVRFGELGGEVAGTIYGAGKLGTLGEVIAKKALPARMAVTALRGGGTPAKLARALAPDVAYGAGYGAVTEGDPLTSAALAGTGSAAGQLASKAVGAAVRGANLSAPVQKMRDAGIALTPAQTLGGWLKGAEDKLTSAPILGDLIRNRRIEGMRDFNKAAFREAGGPIGATPGSTGEQGLQELSDAVGKSYDNATAGVDVPLDQQLADELRAALEQGKNLAPDFADKFKMAVQNRVVPALDKGSLTGEDYQQAVRGLKGYKAETSKPGFEEDYRNSLSSVQDALTGTMMRGGGKGTVEGLTSANRSYQAMKTLRDAIHRGIGGTQSGEVELFTPAQLQRAGLATEKKFGSRPFADLADAGQQVLPSRVPDSGTAGRLAQYALPGLLAGGAGAGYVSDNPAVETGSDAAKTTLTLGALLAALSTRRGQRAMDTILTRRPEAAQTLGNVIASNSRLAGPALIPLMIDN